MAENEKTDGVVEAEVIPMKASAAEKPVASLIKEFTVPPEQQELLRKTDMLGGAIQRELGSLELQYLSKRAQLINSFDQNRKDYDKLLKECGKTVGVDFEKLPDDEEWNFDFSKMTFKRIDEPKEIKDAPKPS